MTELGLSLRERIGLQVGGPPPHGERPADGAGNGRPRREGQPALPIPSSKLILWLFMGTATMAFSMLLSSYVVRSGLSDWQAFPEPPILWLNTALLVGASLALERARGAVRADAQPRLRRWLGLAGGLGVLFLAGQLLAWSQLSRTGLTLPASPSASYFYLISGLHGAHVVGGLVGWLLAARAARRRAYTPHSHLGLELCATYWHFLLLVWTVMFLLLWLG